MHTFRFLKTVAFVSFAALLFSGCGGKLKRLSSAELSHYNALKVWWDVDEKKSYLKLKTEPERSAWLKSQGYWDRFYQYPEERRAEIVAGSVGVGWTYDQVYMAWGQPHQKRMAAGRKAERSELYVYRFETDYEGVMHVWYPNSKLTREAIEMFRLEVYVDNGVVVKMDRQEGW
jgi:hypothetical protein